MLRVNSLELPAFAGISSGLHSRSLESFGGLEGCSWYNVVCHAGGLRDVVEGVYDSIKSLLNLPANLVEEITGKKLKFLKPYWAMGGPIWKGMRNGWNGVWDGIIELGKGLLDDLKAACALFQEYKKYINVAVQIVQQDYARAALSLAVMAAEAVGAPIPVNVTDSELVRLADFACGALNTALAINAIAGGFPEPPPIGPSNILGLATEGNPDAFPASPGSIANYITRQRNKGIPDNAIRNKWVSDCKVAGRVLCVASWNKGWALVAQSDAARSSKNTASTRNVVVVGSMAAAALILLR